MSVPAERLPRRRRSRAALARQQGLTDVLRLSEGITRGQLARILQDAAAQAESTLLFNLRAGGLTRADQLRAAMRGLGGLSSALWDQVHQEIRAGVRSAAELAADHTLIREIQMGMPERVLQQYAPGMHFNALQSANDIISRHTNGFTLSQRVYRNSQATVLQVGRIIDRALALQLGHRELATQVRRFISPRTPGGVSYAAQRLARTEINNAHHDTTIRLSKDRPWVNGYKWNLSGSHPRPDICNEYAGEDHDNLGAGVFAKANIPSKPHPQCLCYLLVVQQPRAEFLESLVGGNFDEYLRTQGARR